MPQSPTENSSLKTYFVWDKNTRVFHWINFICITALMGLGLVIYNSKALGVNTEGKILLKTLHVYFGYVFSANLLWRIIWGFIGSVYSRWKSIIPIGQPYFSDLKHYVSGIMTKNPPGFLGHNPIARMMVTVLFLVLTAQSVTGLVLAGTDLYYPPFGHEIAKWVSNSPEDQSTLKDIKPYSKVNIDEDKYKQMRQFREPFITVHEFVFFTLLILISFHIIGVIMTEIREKNGLVSAMISGSKVFEKKPVDLVDDDVRTKKPR
jgi:cytochrome b